MREEPKTKLDPRRIPDPVRMHLAQTVYNAVLQDIQRPEFQEGYQRWKAEQTQTTAHV